MFSPSKEDLQPQFDMHALVKMGAPQVGCSRRMWTQFHTAQIVCHTPEVAQVYYGQVSVNTHKSIKSSDADVK